MRLPFHAFFLALLVISSTAHSQGWFAPGAVPQDLRVVALQIDGVTPQLARYGFDEVRVRADVQRRLQAVGMEVIGPAEAVKRPDAHLLLVDLHLQETALQYYSFLITVKLMRKIPLPQSPESFTSEPVWSDWKIGQVGMQRTGPLAEYLMQVIDEFANSYLEMTHWGAG